MRKGKGFFATSGESWQGIGQTPNSLPAFIRNNDVPGRQAAASPMAQAHEKAILKRIRKGRKR